MKRTLLIPLLCMFFMQPLLANDFSISIQATVGVPFEIDPAVDCGIPKTSRNYMAGMDGLYYPAPNSSSTYTPSIFTYEVENYTGYSNATGRVFMINPISTGITSFRLNVKKAVYNANFGSWGTETHSVTSLLTLWM